MSEPVSFITRVKEEELASYKEAAVKAGLSVNELVRRTMNAVISGDYRIGTPPTVASEVLRACSVGFRPTPAPEDDKTPPRKVKLCPRCQRFRQPACEACKKKAGLL